jgi:hypothetical protein
MFPKQHNRGDMLGMAMYACKPSTALGRLRQDCYELKAGLSYIETLLQTKKRERG